MSKSLYISWAPYCSRSDNTAREFHGRSYMVYFGAFGSNYFTVAIKYLLQTIKTLAILLRERPDVVFVMSPAVFANLPVFLYCKLFSKKYVVDAHTGALSNPMWKKVQFLQKFFCKKALFTIVTCDNLAQEVQSWGGKSIILPDVPIKPPISIQPNFINNGNFNITFVSSFSTDEPIKEIISAAKEFKDISFFITGKINNYANTFINQASSNVHFTNFLSDKEYYGLMEASDLVIALTKNRDTMQRGAYEAIYLEKPVITSDWPILRKNFPYGALLVDNSVDSIINAIKAGQTNIDELTKQAIRLKKEKMEIWQANKAKILSHFKAA